MVYLQIVLLYHEISWQLKQIQRNYIVMHGYLKIKNVS